jgi:hypothetical protein
MNCAAGRRYVFVMEWHSVRRKTPGRTAGEFEMRFILGLIIGIALVIGGAYVHDNTEAGAGKPLVYWDNVNTLEHTTFDYLKAQFDRLMKWATSS